MDDSILRRQLLELLDGGSAHITFEDVVADFPADRINSRISGVPYSPWELLEHMRRAQFDLLDFIRNPKYAAPAWPDDYWPPKNREATETQWRRAVENFESDLDELKAMVKDPKQDLTAQLSHGPKYNLLREILLAADHSAYHLGELVVLKRALGIF